MCSTVIWQPEGGEGRGGAASINYFNSRPREIPALLLRTEAEGKKGETETDGEGSRKIIPRLIKAFAELVDFSVWCKCSARGVILNSNRK